MVFDLHSYANLYDENLLFPKHIHTEKVQLNYMRYSFPEVIL